MKKIIRVARIELSILFYSPIAWLLIIVFLILTSLAYTTMLGVMTTMQELGGDYLRDVRMLTFNIFSFQEIGVFNRVLANLYIYLPLITMGLISREINTGTIKLLYSSPVKVRDIVLGKFLAMMAFCFVMILILLIAAVAGIIHIRHVEVPLLLAGLLSVYLLLCTYAAIGLFMSCLTSYQVVAAISTFVVFALLNYVGTVGQDLDGFREITYYLSLSRRTNELIGGLINSRDIIYFLALTSVFLAFSIIKLQSGRETKPALRQVIRYSAVSLSLILVIFISSRPQWTFYRDVSATQMWTITPSTQKLLKDMDKGPLQVTSYINFLDEYYEMGAPVRRMEDVKRWEDYVRFKPDLQLNYVYYYDSIPNNDDNRNFYKDYAGLSLQQIAEKQSKARGMAMSRLKTPAEIRQLVDLRLESNRYVMQLKYNGKTTFLRLFDDNTVWPSETEVSVALKRLMAKKMPRLIFVESEWERSPLKTGDREYFNLNLKTYRNALVNQGFDFDTVDLRKQDIPAGITCLIIADPRTGFEPGVQQKIQQYIDAGGNALIMTEPGKQSIINPFIRQFGVQVMDKCLVQPSDDFSADLVRPLLTNAAVEMFKGLSGQQQDSTGVTMPGVAALSFIPDGPYDIQPILMTNEQVSWSRSTPPVLDSAKIIYSPGLGDEKKSYPAGLRLKRMVNGNEQRIIITSDADWLDNTEFDRHSIRRANRLFSTAVFGWFANGEFPTDLTRPASQDTHVNLTVAQMKGVKIFLLWVLPALLLVSGVVLLTRRRRK